MEKESLARVLNDHPLTQGFSNDDLEFLAGCTKNRRVPAGEFIWRDGKAADAVWLVRQGKVALEAHLGHRGVVVVETVHAGDTLGWAALFPPHVWHMDARVAKDLLAFEIDGACLRRKMDAEHSFGYRVSQNLLEIVHRRLVRTRLGQLDIYRADS